MYQRFHFLSAILGNLFEHYDKSLFAFLAPFLAPLFFDVQSPLLSLILTFGIMPLGLLSRPFGALIFGKIGDCKGRKRAVMLSLIGMSIVTFLMGFLPTYKEVGYLSPILLALGRLAQSFFAAGEVTGGALLVLENCDPKKRSLFSSLYDCSSIVGILIASCAVTLLAQFNLIQQYWRFLYFAGGLTAFVGVILRLFAEEKYLRKYKKPELTYWVLWKEKSLFLTLCLVIGFSYAIYESATTLLNSYLPFVSDLNQIDSFWIGTGILVLDLLLLPLFGYLAMRLSPNKTMLFFIFAIAICSCPLFHTLYGSSYLKVTIIRVVFVILGVGFSAPLYAWAVEVTPYPYRYTLISLSTAIGSQLFGAGTCPVSLWLYKKSGWAGAPGLYLSILGTITFLTIQKLRLTEPRKDLYPKLLN